MFTEFNLHWLQADSTEGIVSDDKWDSEMTKTQYPFLKHGYCGGEGSVNVSLKAVTMEIEISVGH